MIFDFNGKKKVYALVGRSGSGKSFRAQRVAKDNGIKLIIDDGLLIKENKIIAGISAKEEDNFLTAVKRALFQDPEHRQEILNKLDQERFKKILIIGTSEKMAVKISSILNLPDPEIYIHIEDVASQDEINTAMRIRYTEGKHVIPVPPDQVARSYASIIYDTIAVGAKSNKTSYNTLVKPKFTNKEGSSLSETVLKQMINHCLNAYQNLYKTEEVTYKIDDKGYNIELTIRTPSKVEKQSIEDLKEYISDTLEKYGNIMISSINLKVNTWD